MEKSGMGSGERFRRRLLTVLVSAWCLAPAGIFAQKGPDEAPTVLVETAPEQPARNTRWTVTILVDHPYPAEVAVQPPVFPAQLVLERVRTDSRRVDTYNGKDERWTAVQFQFTPLSPGVLNLGAFVVRVPGREVRTAALSLLVAAEPGAAPPEPRLVWSPLPDQLRLGDAVELTLSLLPPVIAAAQPQVVVPENVLMETPALSETERRAGVVLKVRLSALEAPRLVLPAVSLALGPDTVLTAPAAGIRVLAVSGSAGSPSQSAAAVEPEAVEPAPPAAPAVAPPFPDTADRRGGLWSRLFDGPRRKSLAAAAALWTEGEYARALAALRSAERRSEAGPGLTATRRELEARLGIAAGGDEVWAPVRVLGIAAGLSFFLALLFLPRKNRGAVTSRRIQGYTFTGLFLALGLGALAWLALPGSARGGDAVLLSCVARRVPDDLDDDAGFGFREGQPVYVRTRAGAWAYVETSDGQAGWIPADRMIPY